MDDGWLQRWGLDPDGGVIVTRTARLWPVRRGRLRLMLRLSAEAEDARGAAVLDWWRGDGAARVIAQDGPALLMERAVGGDLDALARQDDGAACRIICAVAARLHAPRPGPHPAGPPPGLVPLQQWFRALHEVAGTQGGTLARAARIADDLLADPGPPVVLHGDLHHGNVLDFGGGDWRAIDPKGLLGPRAFDLVPLFTNPDLADPARPLAAARFAARIVQVADAAQVERAGLLRWIAAGAALSAAWFIADGDPKAAIARDIAGRALADLDR